DSSVIHQRKLTEMSSSFFKKYIQFYSNKELNLFREPVKSIFKFTNIDLVRTAKNALINEYIDQAKYTKACDILDNGFEDAFQYTVIGQGHNQLKSTNLLEH